MSNLPEHPAFKAIVAATAKSYGLSSNALIMPGKKRPIPEARFIAVYLIRKHMRNCATLSSIASAFNKAGEDWTLLAIKSAKDLRDVSPLTRATLEALDAEFTKVRAPLYRAA